MKPTDKPTKYGRCACCPPNPRNAKGRCYMNCGCWGERDRPCPMLPNSRIKRKRK